MASCGKTRPSKPEDILEERMIHTLLHVFFRCITMCSFPDPHPDTPGSFPKCYSFHLLRGNHLPELLFLWLDCPRPVS